VVVAGEGFLGFLADRRFEAVDVRCVAVVAAVVVVVVAAATVVVVVVAVVVAVAAVAVTGGTSSLVGLVAFLADG
jgi:hypothetical protein